MNYYNIKDDIYIFWDRDNWYILSFSNIEGGIKKMTLYKTALKMLYVFLEKKSK
jgi:hypothetical protein